MIILSDPAWSRISFPANMINHLNDQPPLNQDINTTRNGGLARAGKDLIWLDNTCHTWRNKYLPISAEIIQHKADHFWDIMYHCILGKQCLDLFSNGSLHQFQSQRQRARDILDGMSSMVKLEMFRNR